MDLRYVASVLVPVVVAAVAVPTPAPVPRRPVPTPVVTGCANMRQVKFLGVGDSITAGVTMYSTESESYTARLVSHLRRQCVEAVFVREAIPGVTCDHWAPQVANLMATHDPDVVLLNCGTNNNLLTASASQITAWMTMYNNMVQTMLDHEPTTLVYPSLVQYSMPLSTQAMRDRCTGLGGEYASLELWQREEQINTLIENAVPVDERVPDLLDFSIIPFGYLDECGVHPTPRGYTIMADLIMNHIAAKLELEPVAVPCGMTGGRRGQDPPMYVPC